MGSLHSKEARPGQHVGGDQGGGEAGGRKVELKTHIRWLIRRDMPQILEIENEGVEPYWIEEDFIRSLRQRNCIGMIAENLDAKPAASDGTPKPCDEIAGFMIYELENTRLRVLNFCVARKHRRKGIGRQMVEKLLTKLSHQRRDRITIEIRESNLPAQQFFSECGFKAVSVLRGYYDDPTEDAYLMIYRYEKDAKSTFEPVNRITRLSNP